MRGREEKGEGRMFILFVVLILAAGVAMLIWGQYNSANQIYDLALARYGISEQLAADEDWAKTEADAVLFEQTLSKGDAWAEQNKAEQRSFSASAATEVFPKAPVTELSYEFYDNSSDKTVILLHGFLGSFRELRAFAPFWWENGFNVIIPTQRGYQEEVLAVNTFGVWESYDLQDLILDAGLQDKYVAVHAEGVGAAAAVILASRGTVAGIDLIVADSVYDNLKTLELRQMKRQFSLGDFLCGMLLDRIIKSETGIDVKSVDISELAASSGTKAVFVYGTQDGFSDNSDLTAVFDAWQGEKRLVAVDARHGMCWAASQQDGEYQKAIREMFTN